MRDPNSSPSKRLRQIKALTVQLIVPQHAGIGSGRVIVGKNDRLDAIFRRMALDQADLASIRQRHGFGLAVMLDAMRVEFAGRGWSGAVD